MKNMIEKTRGKYSNMAMLSLKSETGYGRGSDEATAVIERFFKAGSMLGEGEFICLQISSDSSNRFSEMIFSSCGVDIYDEDYNWIFKGCASTVVSAPLTLERFDSEGRYLYEFSCDETVILKEESPSGRRSCYKPADSIKMEYFEEMLGMLMENSAMIRFFAECSGNRATGRVIISLRERISLRIRTIMSMTFPGLGIVNCSDKKEERIPYEKIEDGLKNILLVLMCRELTGNEKKEGISYTPIEDMELSVRAYNCLKRFGIDTVEQLNNTSDEELMKIRNLGRRCFEEVKEKLADMKVEEVFTPKLTSASYMEMLDELIGLDDVKKQVRKIAAFARMKQDVPDGCKVPMVFNMEFVGNPGTAKTTVARILAGILNEVGLLETPEYVEVGRADLVAKYVGQTANKVRHVFETANGKLLFIDEAYSLSDFMEGDYGDEAITTIVQEMENRRDHIIVVFAGYPDKMENYVKKNPGLKSRVPFRIVFKDYSAEEMFRIAEKEAEKRGFTISQESQNSVLEIMERVSGKAEMGNGRFCRNLIENAILAYASRVYGDEQDSPIKDFVLRKEDFAQITGLSEIKVREPIGFAV